MHKNKIHDINFFVEKNINKQVNNLFFNVYCIYIITIF